MLKDVLFGTYTDRESNGVYHATFDTETGEMSKPVDVLTVDNPTYLRVVNGKTLLTIVKEGDFGGIASYSLDDSAFTLNSDALKKGPNPCYVGFDEKRQLVFTANYHTAEVGVYKLNDDQTLTLTDTDVHTGKGPRPEQDSAHVHYTDITPDERLVAVDLGNDTVTIYNLSDEGKLSQQSVYHTGEGFGPRHIVFNSKGEYAYLVGELSSKVQTLKYNKDDGSFEKVAELTTIPNDWTEHNGAAAIRISSDDKFVYVSNRGYNSIAVYAVQDDYTLELIQNISTEGDFPRDFALDPSEKFIVVDHQKSDNATIFKRLENGKLELLRKDIYLSQGVSVFFSDYSKKD